MSDDGVVWAQGDIRDLQKELKVIKELSHSTLGVLDQMIEEIRQLDKRVEYLELAMPRRVPIAREPK